MNKKIAVVILSLLLFVTLSQTVLAVSWWPLVPCGTSVNPTPCNQCDLFRLLKNIIDFVLIGLAADNIAPEWWKFTCSVTTPAQQPPPAPQPPPSSNLCSQPAQLAASNNVPYPRKNAPELDQLISCVNSRIGGLIDQNQIFTYEKTNDLCNYTRGQQTCGSCAHSAFSCHYGGRDGTQGSLAVDFNAKNGNETTLFNELKKLESTCQFGYILFENTHTHVSTKSCSGN